MSGKRPANEIGLDAEGHIWGSRTKSLVTAETSELEEGTAHCECDIGEKAVLGFCDMASTR